MKRYLVLASLFLVLGLGASLAFDGMHSINNQTGTRLLWAQCLSNGRCGEVIEFTLGIALLGFAGSLAILTARRGRIAVIAAFLLAWMAVSTFALTGISQRVQSISQRVQSIASSVNSIAADVSDISEIKNDVEEIKSDVSDLGGIKSDVEEIKSWVDEHQ